MISRENAFSVHLATLTRAQFDKLSSFIHCETGIRIPPSKKTMVEVRLRKRLRAVSMNNFEDYCKYLFSDEGFSNEIIHMIDVITTNKTDFFREPKQFPFLVETAVPELIQKSGAGVRRRLRVWSAGCSTGEEPYTVAMCLSDFAESHKSVNFDYSILATDISTDVLKRAINAVYDFEKVEPVPMHMKKKYLLKSKDSKKRLVRIVPEIRAKIQFERLNFMDDSSKLQEKMDIIFCRNVIIYFDKATQEKIIRKLIENLVPEGYLFIGHSETLFAMNLPLIQQAPSIYKKKMII